MRMHSALRRARTRTHLTRSVTRDTAQTATPRRAWRAACSPQYHYQERGGERRARTWGDGARRTGRRAGARRALRAPPKKRKETRGGVRKVKERRNEKCGPTLITLHTHTHTRRDAGGAPLSSIVRHRGEYR